MRVVVAPDKFKGTLGAAEVARAIASGVRAAVPKAVVEQVPIADGGEGTVAALARTAGACLEMLTVPSAKGTFHTEIARLDDGSVCLEVASTSGSQPKDALGASSLSTGEAMVAAYEREPSRLLVAIGGSASTDAGTGIGVAHGWRFHDRGGRPLPLGGAALIDLATIDGRDAREPPCPIVGLCDVAAPLLGDVGAAPLFAPQKGASPEDVAILEQGLARWAAAVRERLGRDLDREPGAGAGGGIGAGLAAFTGARLVDGFAFVADVLGLRERVERSDLIITGEGRLDRGSLAGKAATGVARLARAAGVPCLAVCGEIALASAELHHLGFAGCVDVASLVGKERAFGSPYESIACAAEQAVERWQRTSHS